MNKIAAIPYRNGYNPIASSTDRDGIDLDFGILMQERGQRDVVYSAKKESVIVLLMGDVEIAYGDTRVSARRMSLFTQSPTALHVAYNVKVTITCHSDRSELAIIKTDNVFNFPPTLYTSDTVKSELHGAGVLDDTMSHYERVLIDSTNAPLSNLVVGEWITPAGRWSSYPPHSHRHPELVFYKFNPADGYGLCQIGNEAGLLFEGDVVKVRPNIVHPHVAAPGFMMYSLWVILHLGDDRYVEPTYDARYTAMLDEIAAAAQAAPSPGSRPTRPAAPPSTGAPPTPIASSSPVVPSAPIAPPTAPPPSAAAPVAASSRIRRSRAEVLREQQQNS